MVYCSWSLLWSVIRNEYNKELSHQHFGPPSSLSCLVFYGTQVSLGSGLWVPASLTTGALWNFADDTNSIQANDAHRAIWGWWFSSNRWWSSPMWAWRSPRGAARWWYRSCTEYWSWCAGELWSCWRQYMLLEHWEVTAVMEMVVGQ